jgi:hypothetical protein
MKAQGNSDGYSLIFQTGLRCRQRCASAQTQDAGGKDRGDLATALLRGQIARLFMMLVHLRFSKIAARSAISRARRRRRERAPPREFADTGDSANSRQHTVANSVPRRHQPSADARTVAVLGFVADNAGVRGGYCAEILLSRGGGVDPPTGRLDSDSASQVPMCYDCHSLKCTR